jgi:hypothetical protein
MKFSSSLLSHKKFGVKEFYSSSSKTTNELHYLHSQQKENPETQYTAALHVSTHQESRESSEEEKKPLSKYTNKTLIESSRTKPQRQTNLQYAVHSISILWGGMSSCPLLSSSSCF